MMRYVFYNQMKGSRPFKAGVKTGSTKAEATRKAKAETARFAKRPEFRGTNLRVVKVVPLHTVKRKPFWMRY